MNELEIFLGENKIDFLCVSEHWLLNDEISTICLNGYNLMAYFSRSKAIHGGVAIYCLDRYECTSIKLINSLSTELHCEIVGIKYNDVNILTVYRSPNGDINLFLENLSRALETLLN